MEVTELVKEVCNQLYKDRVHGYNVKIVTAVLSSAAKLGYIKDPSNKTQNCNECEAHKYMANMW